MSTLYTAKAKVSATEIFIRRSALHRTDKYVATEEDIVQRMDKNVATE